MIEYKSVNLKKKAGARLRPRFGQFFNANSDLWKKLKAGETIEVLEEELTDFDDPAVDISPVKDRGKKKEEKPKKKEGGEKVNGTSSTMAG